MSESGYRPLSLEKFQPRTIGAKYLTEKVPVMTWDRFGADTQTIKGCCDESYARLSGPPGSGFSFPLR